MSVATMQVLDVDQLSVLADGGYSNAQAIAECERDNIEVAAPIKRGAMNTEHFRPVQFAYDEVSDTIRCPAGETLILDRRASTRAIARSAIGPRRARRAGSKSDARPAPRERSTGSSTRERSIEWRPGFTAIQASW